MATKGRIDMLVRFSCFLLLMGHSYPFLHKLQQGGELKDGDELISATGKFKFGFFTPSSTPDSSKRYVGVWYYKPTDRTESLYNEDKVRNDRSQMQSLKVVWIANRNNPILHKSSTIRIDSSDGNLKIFPNGENPVAITSVGVVRNTTSVSLLKSGNLVLHVPYPNGSIKHSLWESFDYPTDTLLPDMKLGINFLTGHQWFLQSWFTYDSPEQGRFNVGMDPNVTSQLMVSCRGQGDQTSGDLLNGKFKSWDISGYKFSYISNEKEKYFNYSVSENVTSFPMLQIDWNGNLRDDRGQSIASCSVFSQYSVSDEYKRPRMCNSSSSYLVPKSGFMPGDGIKFRESDNMTLADCRQKCYKDCSCVAYAATNRANDTGCEIWSRGTEFIESNDDNSREIYVEFIPPVIAKKKWWIARKCLVITVAVALVVILLCSLSYVARRKYKGKEEKWWQSLMVVLLVPLLCYFCYLAGRKLIAEVQTIMNRRKLLRELGDEESSSNFNNGGQTKEKDQTTSHELKIFKFQTIAIATDNFSTANKLGEGGFGPVYKGKLLDDREIAIKRLSRRSGQGIVEFKNEAKLIAKLQHTNLVKLVGCSLQGEERILVYEYMHNKSLDFFIFDSNRKKLLDWKKRFNIIEGIAQGLIYLHKYSRLRVIHRDLKASNILLDDQMNPKISDFGTARIFGADESEANTNRVVGTYGYMCPEYAMNGIFSMKTDVFSFGVLVLEIVSGKKNNSRYLTEQPLNLVGYAWQRWNEGKGLELIDTTLDQSCCPNDQALRCLHVGLLCVQDQATDRPTISDVVSMLTNETMLLPAPKQPTFFTDVNFDEE